MDKKMRICLSKDMSIGNVDTNCILKWKGENTRLGMKPNYSSGVTRWVSWTFLVFIQARSRESKSESITVSQAWSSHEALLCHSWPCRVTTEFSCVSIHPSPSISISPAPVRSSQLRLWWLRATASDLHTHTSGWRSRHVKDTSTSQWRAVSISSEYTRT